MTLSPATPGAIYDPTQAVLQRRYGPVRQLGRGVWLVLWQSLQVEVREWSAIAPMGALGFLVVLIMSLIFDAGTSDPLALAAGVLWGALYLAGPVGLERQNGGPDFHAFMSYLLSSPLPRPALYLGMWLFQGLLLLCTSCVALIAVAVFLNAPLGQVWILISIVLGCMGFSAAGVVVSALTATLKKSQGLLAVVVLPLTLPLFLIGTSLCRAIWNGASWSSFQHWVYLLLLYNGMVLWGGLWASEQIWQEWQ